MAKKFTVPKLKSYPLETGKDWYVWFRYEGGNPIRISEGINKVPDFNERILEGNALAKVLHLKLKNGWIPETRQKTLPKANDLKYSISQGYKIAFDILQASKRSDKTKSRYKTHYNYFIEALNTLKFSDFNLTDFEPYHINLILEKIGEKKPESDVFFNIHLTNCSSFFSTLAKKFIIKNNPVSFIDLRDYTAPEKILLTDKQYIEIMDHLEKINYNFVTFLKCQEIGVRPGEIREVKCGMIVDGFFELPKHVTKNDKAGIVPIPDSLMERLNKMDLSDPENYLFGMGLPRSRDINKKFVPSRNILSKNVANNFWRKEVKIKFGIDSNMYYLKSSSANKMRREGIDLETVRDQFRHSTTTITKIYATEDYRIRMNEVKKTINKKASQK